MENKFTPVEFTTSLQPTEYMDSGDVIDNSEEVTLFDASLVQKDTEPYETMTFKEWKAKDFEAASGILVTDVPTSTLFTTQDWLDPTKMARAVKAQDEGGEIDDHGQDNAFVVEGVVFAHPKPHMGRVPVILEGNHRAVDAAFHHDRLSFKIIEKDLPENAKVWGVNNLLTKFGGLAR
jgi:hypothetical protein